MMPLRIFVWSILCMAAFVMGQSDPIDISTAGASQLRLKGQLTLSRNPASLGYSASARQLEPSIDDTLSIKTLVEPDSIDTTSTTILPVDTLATDSLSVEPQDTTSFFTDDILLDEFLDEVNDLVNESDDTSRSDPIPIQLEPVGPRFSMSLLSVSAGFGNGPITPNWINDQLYGGKDLRDPVQKEEFFSGLSEDIYLFISNSSSLPFLNLSLGANVISIGRVLSYTSVNIPNGLVQLPFKGLENGEELNLNSLDIQHVSYVPISYSRGFVLRPGTLPFGRKSYLGLRAALLIGLVSVHTEMAKGSVIGENDATVLDMEIELKHNLSVEDNLPGQGLGAGLDIGLITEINDKLIVGLSIEDLAANILWTDGTTYTASLSGSIRADEFSQIADDDSSSNPYEPYISQSENRESSDHTTVIPMAINISGAYAPRQWVDLNANLKLYLSDDYWGSTVPILSLSSELFPLSKLPFRIGIALGGETGFIWGAGFSLRLGSLILDIGGGQYGGSFNDATGMNAGFSLRIEK
ncbi:MAG: hypothetical protein CL701_02255 [Chloroflexi bacterium]|nr:hypothetical protein [Chloroflexota bacterium]